MRPAGVAQSEARLLASGALLQQVAQGAGLLVLLTIVTILARRLDSVAELGAYGLVASLAGYLLVLRNSVASSAVRAMAGAVDPAERRLVFSAAAVLYAVAGVATGLLIAARLLQGVAGGMLIPQNSGLIQELFSGAERGRAFGFLGATVGLATAAGPVIVFCTINEPVWVNRALALTVVVSVASCARMSRWASGTPLVPS